MEKTKEQTTTAVRCTGCRTKLTVFRYCDKEGWRCKRCSPPREECRYQDFGCPQTDIENKCWKHFRFFCKQRTSCAICPEGFNWGMLSEHYISKHQNITISNGSPWRPMQTNDGYCLLSGAPVTVVCCFKLNDVGFQLNVYIPVPSERMYKFKCTVKVFNSFTGFTQIFTPDVLYDEVHDWCIEMKKENFDPWSTDFDVIVKIDKMN